MTDDRSADPTSGTSLFTPSMIIVLAAVALFLVLVFQNSARADLALPWRNGTAPAWAFFIMMFALGRGAGWFADRGRK